MLHGSIGRGTLRNYTSGLKKFIEFLSKTKIDVPAPLCSTSAQLRFFISLPGVIESFICFCFQQNLCAKSTGGYIDGLKYFSTDLEGIPFFPHEPVISRLLTGFQKMGKRPGPPSLGIDVLLLRRIITHVDSMDLGADTALWKCMFSIAFFGAFRVSEFLVSDDELKLLSFNRVRLVANNMVEFALIKTKNNSNGPVQQVLFAPLPGDIACPVRALLIFLSVRTASTGAKAFFIDKSGNVVTPERFNLVLRRIPTSLEILEPDRYTAKSFRIGAASMAYSLNMSVEDIQALGRWASSAFLYYIRSGARAIRVCSIHKRLAAVV